MLSGFCPLNHLTLSGQCLYGLIPSCLHPYSGENPMFRRLLLVLPLIVLVTVLLTASHCYANAPASGDTAKVYSAEQLRQDFQQLYQDLQRGSYDLFAHIAKDALDQSFQRYLAEINKPMTELQAHKHFMQFVALAQIAHTRIDFPTAQYREFLKAGGKTLPFTFRIDGDEVRVASYFGAATQVQPDDRLLSINGIPITEFLPVLQRYLAADNVQLLAGLTGEQIAPLLWLHEGERPAYTLILQRRHSDETYVLQQATLTHSEQTQHASAVNADSAAGNNENTTSSGSDEPRQHRILANNIGYLQPGPFYNVYATTDAQIWDTTEFHRFIDEAFSAFVNANVAAVIIDLRNNPGGTNSFSDHMLAWFADQPFRFASDFRVRVSELSRAANRARMPANGPADAITLQLEQFYDGHQQGEVFSFPLNNTKPHDKPRNIAGSGVKVLLLINRYSYSNAVSVAAIAQDYHFASVIGEPTADLATTYGAMETFTLQHTGIVVGYPKALIIRPNGDTRAAGVVPDIQLSAENTDPATTLQQVVDYIKTNG